MLDEIFTLSNGSWKKINKIEHRDEKLSFKLTIILIIKNENQFIGFNGEKSSPTSILLKNNNLHFDIIINPEKSIGKKIKLIYQTLL